jgi:hypothetical protein
MKIRLLSLSCAIISPAILAATAPASLYSTLIYDKTYTTTHAVAQSAWTFPQYTDSKGVWKWFAAQTWTSGFYPAMAYLLNHRVPKCPDINPSRPAGKWLAIGRKWSEGLVQIESNNQVRHDVGFISFPFQEELLV